MQPCFTASRGTGSIFLAEMPATVRTTPSQEVASGSSYASTGKWLHPAQALVLPFVTCTPAVAERV